MKAYELYALQEAEKININGGSDSTRKTTAIDIAKPTAIKSLTNNDPNITLLDDIMNPK